jgi:hypothetical protein
VSDPAEGFVLLGTPADETRLLVHRGHGFSIPIPGHPVLAASIPPGLPAYDVVVELTDLPVEIGVRIDRMPLGPEPVALAATLTQAYAASRAAELRRVGPLRGRLLGQGFDGGANTIYARRDAGPAPQMEHVQVVVHEEDDATYAVYLTTRYAAADVDVVRWANLRTAMAGTQRWDADDPRTEAPRLWPAASAFAELGPRLLLSPAAHAEAQRKSAELGPLTEPQAAALVDVLISTATSDEPPTHDLHPHMLEIYCRQIAACGPTQACEVILRNTPELRTIHDLRAWCWQGIWALGHRPGQVETSN